MGLWVNVASSIYTLPGFVNLDNDVRLRLLPVYPILKPVIPARHHEWIEAFGEAQSKGHTIKVHDCRKPLPFPPASVDHVLCSHFLEHLHPAEAEAALHDFHAKLKPGGTIDIIVPDLSQAVDYYLAGRANGDNTAGDRLMDMTGMSRRSRASVTFQILEFMGGFGLQHRWMYDADSLTRRIVQAGFTVLPENTTPSRTFRKSDSLEPDGAVRVAASKSH
jgi:predicted SAM-dependent methyltransferase